MLYKFVHKEDFTFYSNIENKGFKNEWLIISEAGLIQVKGKNRKGYAWNGCSPTWKLFDIYLGTPEGVNIEGTNKPKTYYASMVHDCLYQFKGEIPLSRKQADIIFYDILKKTNFKLAELYYVIVRLFGWIMGKWKTKKN